MRCEYRHNCTCDFILDREHVLELSVITLRPAMPAGGAVDGLSSDADAAASALNAALEYVAHAQLLTDLPEVDRPALVPKRGVPSDHEQLGGS